MGKSAASRRQTGRVGQLLFVAQQAAQALAIERLEPLGLSPRAWGVLSTLAESGPLTQIELATTMAIDRTAMVYLLDDLEQRALVERVRSPQDRRSEEHTSELQSLRHLVCRLLLEKKNKNT